MYDFKAGVMGSFHGPFPPTYSQGLVTWMVLCLVAERGESASNGPQLERGVVWFVVEPETYTVDFENVVPFN